MKIKMALALLMAAGTVMAAEVKVPVKNGVVKIKADCNKVKKYAKTPPKIKKHLYNLKYVLYNICVYLCMEVS